MSSNCRWCSKDTWSLLHWEPPAFLLAHCWLLNIIHYKAAQHCLEMNVSTVCWGWFGKLFLVWSQFFCLFIWLPILGILQGVELLCSSRCNTMTHMISWTTNVSSHLPRLTTHSTVIHSVNIEGSKLTASECIEHKHTKKAKFCQMNQKHDMQIACGGRDCQCNCWLVMSLFSVKLFVCPPETTTAQSSGKENVFRQLFVLGHCGCVCL